MNIHLSNYRKIYILDSLPSGHPQAVFKLVESALVEEAKNKLGIQLDVERILHIKVPVGDTPLARSYEFYHALQVPMQTNAHDCGFYLLHYAHKFMAQPNQYRSIIYVRSNPHPHLPDI
jgi:Ulp1 family protease